MENTPSRDHSVSRRTVVTTAAWAAPVLVTAVATPLAAASGEAPDATFAQQLWDVVAPSGVQTQFGLYGRAVQDGQLVDAALPPNCTVTFTAPAGGTVVVTGIVTGTSVTNPDGSVTVTFAGGSTEALAYVVITGTGTATASGDVPGLTPPTFTVTQTII